MITAPIQRIRRVWADHRQRPFWRMVQLFVDRIFRGGGDSDTEGLDLGVGLVLTLLAMPGGFVSILLFDKYGTFCNGCAARPTWTRWRWRSPTNISSSSSP